MNSVLRHLWSYRFVLLGALMFLAAGIAFSAPAANPGVLPAQSKPYGKTYPEWAAAWLRLNTSIPADRNPLFDQDGRFCHEGQSPPVFILSSNTGGYTVRSCTIAAGQSILLSPGGTFGLLGIDGATEEELRAGLNDFLRTNIANVQVEINGKLVRDLSRHLVTSGLVDLTLPVGNFLGLPPGPYQGMIAGYFLLHVPLAVGLHAIRMHDEFPAIGFVSDVTYYITVVPHR
jgi:hypothetical protein